LTRWRESGEIVSEERGSMGKLWLKTGGNGEVVIEDGGRMGKL